MGRLQKLPPYLFAALDAAKRRARESGVAVVDLGIGDPDRPTPPELIRVMTEAIADPTCHRYPAQRGDTDLKRAIAGWLRRRHGVEVDPVTQVLVLIGSKEGLAHLPITCVEEGDNTLVPDIGYPVYAQSTILAGGQPRTFHLRAESGFLPDLDEVASLMDDRTVTILEWAEIVAGVLPSDVLRIRITSPSEESRILNLSAGGTSSAAVLEASA